MKRDPKPSVTYALWSAKFRINLGSEKKKCVCRKKKEQNLFCIIVINFVYGS